MANLELNGNMKSRCPLTQLPVENAVTSRPAKYSSLPSQMLYQPVAEPMQPGDEREREVILRVMKTNCGLLKAGQNMLTVLRMISTQRRARQAHTTAMCG